MAEEVTFTDFVKAISQSPEDVRLRLAKQLKKAGLYSGTPSGKFNNSMYDALTKAETKRVQLATITGPLDRFNFIDDLAAEGTTGGKKKGPTTVRYRQQMRPEAIKATINEVFVDVLGRGASEAEIAKYTKRIQKQLGKTENMAQTTYKDLGGGVQERVERPGFDPQGFLFEQIAGNNEAKQRSIFSFYDAFKKALGV